MALRCLRVLRVIRTVNMVRINPKSTTINYQEATDKIVQLKTENKIIYLEDPDVFGTLSKSIKSHEDMLEDEGDIKEQEFLSNIPLPSQKLTIKQYANLIKQYINHKRLKEALDILEVRMLNVDKVKPENYIYNILIGACADVGYTKKAFKLYNDMKKRALKPTGDTYTCLFNACANSPWAADGLKYAHHLRNFMIEKGIEPNITNYNAMIKAFGRCGDLPAAFQIVDEMMSKNIKLRVHTFNHLLLACISDNKNGLRHALVVWRKMLAKREKPNIYSFNLMLKCVKECNLGNKADIEELIGILQQTMINETRPKLLQFSSPHIESSSDKTMTLNVLPPNNMKLPNYLKTDDKPNISEPEKNNELEVASDNSISIPNNSISKENTLGKRLVPNLLSNLIQMQQVLSLQEVHTVQEKFAVIGGQEDFLKEMQVYSIKPNIKTFTQMVTLLDDTCEAESKLLETMNALDVKADIDFYNMLIKKRCLRGDYDGAFEVKNIIERENKIRKKRHPMKKKLILKFNIMTYGVLALACKTKANAEQLLNDMKENQLKINIEILGTLLKNGAVQSNFEYVLFIMKKAKEEHLKINESFLKHLETFNNRCLRRTEQVTDKINKGCSKSFSKAFSEFSSIYKTWLNEVNAENTIISEHPWQQFRENYPESVQRSNFVIKHPKKFYKRNKKFVKYNPRT